MKWLLSMLVIGFTLATASAQEAPKKPSADEMKQMMESSMGMMVPMMGKMAEASIEAQLAAAEKPETARRIAQFKKALYDALLKQGFSKAQAFSIMVNTPLAAAGSGIKQ